MSDVTVLVLAAGFSRRLGYPKALVKLRDGRTLIRRAIETAREVAPLVLVAANGDVAVEASVAGGAVVPVPDAAEGMAASIRAGVNATTTGALLILLADQWRVTVDDLRRLVDARHGSADAIVASRYPGVVGVPALFPCSAFDALRSLRGDRGARSLLQSEGLRVITVDVPNAAFDCDTACDAESL